MKVVIIGGGPAGLTAAYELLKTNKKNEVIVLEAEDSLGGIAKTVIHNGNRMDLGGHRFFSKSKEITNLWEELMPIQGKPSLDDKLLHRTSILSKDGPDPEGEDIVMLNRNRVSRIYYLNKFFDYPISMKLATFRNMGFVRTIKSGLSYIKSMVIKKKEDSLENFYINRFGKTLYSMFFEKYTEKVWGRHPSEISADWGSQRVKGLSIFVLLKNMFVKSKETSLIENFWYPKYGPGQLWEVMASKIEKMGGKILKNHEVTKINIKDNKIISLECSKETFKGDVFISSMPIKDLIERMGKVPKDIKYIASNLPYRDFMTVGILVNKLKLKNETDIKTLGNIVPDCWIYIQEDDVKIGRMQIFNNWSPYLVKDPKNTVWVGLEYFVNEGDSFWKMDDKKFKEFAVSELVKMNIIEKCDVLDYHVERVKKAYPAYFDTYKDIDKVIDYLNRYDNLYCIGRNGQHRYNNMDHSMMTAIEAVKNINNNIKNKDNIWKVNTEKEYHEEKKES